MVTAQERWLILALVRVRVFSLYTSMRLVCVSARPGFRWLLKWIMKRQVVDNLKHAPCCPANHYHRQRLVFQRCTCGTTTEMGAWRRSHDQQS